VKIRAGKAKDYSSRKYYKAPFFAKPGEIGDLFGYSNFDNGDEIESDFAIIDLETSGLSAATSHIIEIAIIRMTHSGKITDRFETLIKPPDGNVGRPDIHLINERDVQCAPTFLEVAGNILASLDNCIAVAHNAKFEEGFLAAEFSRAGIEVPHIPAIDTMWLAQMELDIFNYKLPTVLSYYGHTIKDAHTAMGDVVSIAKFLPQILLEVPTQLYPVDLVGLPQLPLSKKLKPR
jgi:DNA polymerase III alpha subunit (gram-positive type)